jgi:hypothetical protein
MTISISTYTFSSTLFGAPTVPPWEFTRVSQTFFGVIGEQNLYGRFNHRYITIPYTLTGYSTHVLLQTEIAAIVVQIGTAGSLVYDLGGGDSTTFTQCIFEGFMPSEEPWKDGSGVNGWQQTGQLKFRQVAS